MKAYGSLKGRHMPPPPPKETLISAWVDAGALCARQNKTVATFLTELKLFGVIPDPRQLDAIMEGHEGELLNMSKTREELASVSHDIWTHWMRYQFSVCVQNEDGSLTIPASRVERWLRQMGTDYADLSEKEKDSDREQADKILKAMN